jgi:hypothetical protein
VEGEVDGRVVPVVDGRWVTDGLVEGGTAVAGGAA